MTSKQQGEKEAKRSVSTTHLKWLVKRRSENQKTTLDILLLLRNHSSLIDRSIKYQSLVQELAGIAFSLWRAVFLSDLTGEAEKQMGNVEDFLDFLVNDNIILYQQDKKTREWSFQYYLSNARFRLLDIARKADPLILHIDEIDKVAKSAKDDWDIAQKALARAVEVFQKILEGQE